MYLGMWVICRNMHLCGQLNDTPQAYQRANLVTHEELGLIKRVDRQPRTRIESVLLSEGNTFVQLFIGLLKKVSRSDIQQCLLVWIADALTGEFWIKKTLNWIKVNGYEWTDHEERIPLFIRMNQSDHNLPYLPLLKYIANSPPSCQFIWLTT